MICHHRRCTFRMKHGRGEHARYARIRITKRERVDKPMRQPTRPGVASTLFAGISVLLFARRAGWERSGAFFPLRRSVSLFSHHILLVFDGTIHLGLTVACLNITAFFAALLAASVCDGSPCFYASWLLPLLRINSTPSLRS